MLTPDEIPEPGDLARRLAEERDRGATYVATHPRVSAWWPLPDTCGTTITSHGLWWRCLLVEGHEPDEHGWPPHDQRRLVVRRPRFGHLCDRDPLPDPRRALVRALTRDCVRAAMPVVVRGPADVLERLTPAQARAIAEGYAGVLTIPDELGPIPGEVVDPFHPRGPGDPWEIRRVRLTRLDAEGNPTGQTITVRDHTGSGRPMSG